MIDYTSKEEAIKHLQHVKSTLVDFDNPMVGWRDKYTLELSYLGNVFLRIDTRCFDKTLDEFFEEKNGNHNEETTNNNNTSI